MRALQNTAARVDANRRIRKVSSRLVSVPLMTVVFCVSCVLGTADTLGSSWGALNVSSFGSCFALAYRKFLSALLLNLSGASLFLPYEIGT